MTSEVLQASALRELLRVVEGFDLQSWLTDRAAQCQTAFDPERKNATTEDL
jgi:hypothetical protein